MLSELDKLVKLQTDFDINAKELCVLRVYLADQSHKYIAVLPKTTGSNLM